MSDSGPGRREVAYRLFAAEYDDAELSHSESDEERAPNYVVTPTGARANRVFTAGVLTEVEDVNPEMVRGRVVDPTGAFVTYAGQYQPEALAFLERAEPPTFVALSGKARTFEPDDGDRIYTSVRPESISEVDAETRDRAAIVAAERTLERVGVMASAIESGLEGDRLRAALTDAGVDERLADGVALALEYYGTTPAYLEAVRELSLGVARVVAGDREEAGSLDVAPDEGTGDTAALATLELSEPAEPEPGSGPETETGTGTGSEPPTGGTSTETPTTADPDVETAAANGTEPGTAAATGDEPNETSADAGSESETGAVSGTDPAPVDEVTPSEEATDEAGAAADVADAAGESGEADPGEFELDEAERQEVEEEYGTEFSTADEVDEPGEAGADTPAEEAEVEPRAEPEPEPEPEAEAEQAGDVEAEPEPEPEPEAAAEGEPEPGEPDDAAATGEVDLEDAVVETMEALDEGDGADREAVVETVVEETGADPDDVETAVQDALMSGRCYEPSDGTLKSI